MKKTFLLLIILFLSSFHAKSEVITYKSYNDYINNTGTHYEELRSIMHLFNNVSLLLTKNGKKVKVKCKTIWGFSYKGNLFRIEDKKHTPMLVISNNELVYYENGYAHVEMLAYGKNSSNFRVGYLFSFSKKLDTKIFHHRKGIKKLNKLHPELKEVYKCIKKAISQSSIRNCV